MILVQEAGVPEAPQLASAIMDSIFHSKSSERDYDVNMHIMYKTLIMRNILFKFKAAFSHVNKGIPVQSENSTEWKSALIHKTWARAKHKVPRNWKDALKISCYIDR